MKKTLSLLTSFGLGLALLGAGCTNKLQGMWVSAQPIGGTTAEVEFTKTRIIGTGDLAQRTDATKKSTAKFIVDYRVSKKKDNTLTVDISNPQANIVGNFADDKQQNQWQEDATKYLNANNRYTVTVAADGKSMTIRTSDGQDFLYRRK